MQPYLEKNDPARNGPTSWAVDVADWIADAKEAVEDVGEAAAGAVDFAQNPLKAIAESLQNGASGLIQDLLPALFAATSPDLTVSWFVASYSLSFALGMIAWGVLLLWQMFLVAKGRASGVAFLDAMLNRSGLYFGGVLFGPALALSLVQATKALSLDLVQWGVVDTFADTSVRLVKLLSRDVASIVGGAAVAGLLFFVMVVGLLFVVFMQVILLVTLYLSGVFVPIALAWIVSRKHQEFGLRIVYAWVGLLLSQPLLVYVLGVSFKFISSTMGGLGTGKDGAVVFVQLCAAAVALVMAGLAPLALLKYAPVIPKGGQDPDGPQISADGIGPRSLKEAMETFRSSNSTGTGTGYQPESQPSSPTPAPAGPGEGASSGGGRGGQGALMSRHRELNGQAADSQSGGDGSSPGSPPAGASSAADAPTPHSDSSGAGAGAQSGRALAGVGASGAGSGAGASRAASPVAGSAAVGVMALKKGAQAAQTAGHASADAMDANPSDLPEYRSEDDE